LHDLPFVHFTNLKLFLSIQKVTIF
jgi:hypothetical protein